MIRTKGIITSTHVDRQRERFALSALEGLVEQMRGRVVPVNVEHDPRRPPIGVMVNAELVQLDDGEFGVQAESLIWETSADLDEIASLGLRFEPHLPNDGKVSLALDHSYYKDEQTRRDAEQFCKATGLDCSYYGKKAVEPISQLTIAAGIFLAGSIAGGFFGAIGDDAYQALKRKIAGMVKNNSSKGDKLLVFQFGVRQEEREYLVEVLLENPVEADVQWLMDEGLVHVDQICLTMAPARDGLRRVLLVAEGRTLRISYGMNEHGLPLQFRPIDADGQDRAEEATGEST